METGDIKLRCPANLALFKRLVNARAASSVEGDRQQLLSALIAVAKYPLHVSNLQDVTKLSGCDVDVVQQCLRGCFAAGQLPGHAGSADAGASSSSAYDAPPSRRQVRDVELLDGENDVVTIVSPACSGSASLPPSISHGAYGAPALSLPAPLKGGGGQLAAVRASHSLPPPLGSKTGPLLPIRLAGSSSLAPPALHGAPTATAKGSSVGAGRVEQPGPFAPELRTNDATVIAKKQCPFCARAWRQDGGDDDEGGWVLSSMGTRPSCGSGPLHTCALDTHAWEVILLVDNREVSDRSNRDYIVSRLNARMLSSPADLGSVSGGAEVRSLPLGDFMWVVKRREGTRPQPTVFNGPDLSDAAGKGGKKRKAPVEDPTHHEFLLPYIMERKRTSDLAASMADGRYEEQKHRLRGTRLRVTYIVEGNMDALDLRAAAYGSRPITSKHMKGAMASTSVQSGFRVVNTVSVDDTVSFLASVHRAVVHAFQQGGQCSMGGGSLGQGFAGAGAAAAGHAGLSALDRELCGLHGSGHCAGTGSSTFHVATSLQQCRDDECSLFGRPGVHQPPTRYAQWAPSVRKANCLAVGDLWARALRQVQGISAPRAQSLLERYPTPASLWQAISQAPGGEASASAALAELTVHGQGRAMGQAIAQRIVDLVARYKTAYP